MKHWGTINVKNDDRICTKVSALRNVSGKSWVTIHPAHTETNRNTHSEILWSQVLAGMRKGWKKCPQIVKWPTATAHPDYMCVADGAPEGQGTHHQSERRKTNQDPGIGCWLSKRAKRFLSLCAGATAHLHYQKTLAQEIVNQSLEENRVYRVPHFSL